MRPDLLLARLDLMEASRPSVDYCRAQGVDFAGTVPSCGGVFLAEVEPAGARFEPVEGGRLAAWCDVLAEDAETVIDVVAWPIDQPAHWWTLAGTAPALGLAHAANPATYALGFPLRLHRTPLAWLQAECDGAVILNRLAGGRWLRELEAPRVAAADADHAAEIDAALKAAYPLPRILLPAAA